jgi:hypothetical protein
MIGGLSVSDIVNVQVNLAPLAAQYRNFGALLCLGSSAIIDVSERIRQYANLSEVEADFGTTTPEAIAADLFFSQSPQPAILYIGRWAQNAVNGLLHGTILTPAEQALANFTAFSAGAMNITIDGLTRQLTGMNLSGALNLNGVAAIIQAAIVAAGSTGATVVWDSNNKRFDITSGTTGTTSTVSFARPPAAVGNYVFASNPANTGVITIGGTAVTFVTGTPSGNQVQIGIDLAHTLAALLSFLQASADTNLVKFKYSTDAATHLYLESVTTGTSGNSLTITSDGTNSHATASGATLAGGVTTADDVSTVFGWTLAAGAISVPGIAAETLAACVAILAGLSNKWYGLAVASNPAPSNSDHLAVAAQIEGYNPSRIYGLTYQNTDVLNSAVSSDLPSQLQALQYSRTFSQYSSSSPYAVFSMYGRGFTVNFDANNSTITLKFKQEPGVAAETLTESEAQALIDKNCNVFVNYENNTAIIQEGVMANGYFFDERQGADWIQNRIQNDVYNLLYQSPTKIPQTDAGTHTIVTTIQQSCDAAVNNGWVAPGVWNVAGFGQLNQGMTLTKGYYVYAPPVATQSQADREARKSVPIQVALKLAGAIHSVNVIVTVNR